MTHPDRLPVEGYLYDPVHNRVHSQHQPGTWQYNDNNELLAYGVGIDAVAFTYDANGHTIEEAKATGEVLTYHYNPAERLSEIKRNGATIATYHYDPIGRRIRKETNGRVTWFQYSDTAIVSDHSEVGVLERIYGWPPDGLWSTDPVFIADVTSTGGSSHWSAFFYHNDHSGTPQRLSDIDGTLNWTAL